MKTVEVYSPDVLSLSETVEQFAMGEYELFLKKITGHYPARYYIQLDRTNHLPIKKKVRMLSKSSEDYKSKHDSFSLLVDKIKSKQYTAISL